MHFWSAVPKQGKARRSGDSASSAVRATDLARRGLGLLGLDAG